MKFKEDFFRKEIREEFEITEMMKRAWAAQMEVLQVVIEVWYGGNCVYRL